MTSTVAYESLFAGIDAAADAVTVPYWYRQSKTDTGTPRPAFADEVETLSQRFGAETTPAYYYDEKRGEYIEAPEHTIIINPAWLGDGLEDSPNESAAWATATDQYQSVTAADAYRPLIDAAHAAGKSAAFGSIEAYRNGGQVAIEVLFDDLRVTDETTDTEYVLGFETGYDHFRRSSVWATLLAYNTETGAALRGMSQRFSRQHRGEPEKKLKSWFQLMIERADKLSDELYNAIAEARNYTIDLSETPLTVEELYRHTGFHDEYAADAADIVSYQGNPTAFDLYHAVAELLTFDYDGKRGGKAMREHAGKANQILFQPDMMEKQALKEKKRHLAKQESALSAEQKAAVRDIDDRIETLDDAVETFTSVRDRVESMLDDMDDPQAAES